MRQLGRRFQAALPGETRNVVVGFIRDWLAWREEHQINWTMWGVISGFIVGITAIGVSVLMH